MGPFDYDRYLVDQLVRPIANLYRVTIEETCTSRCHYYGPG